MMLNPVAWANSIAATMVVFYLVLWLLGGLAPELFNLVFNAQFLGADVASLYSAGRDLGTAIGNLLVLVLTGWIFGYVWAWLYNNWAK